MRKHKPEYNQTVENEILREHQRVLIDLAHYAAETVDLQKFMDDAVLRVWGAVEVSHVKILRHQPVHGDLIIESGVGWDNSAGSPS